MPDYCPNLPVDVAPPLVGGLQGGHGKANDLWGAVQKRPHGRLLPTDEHLCDVLRCACPRTAIPQLSTPGAPSFGLQFPPGDGGHRRALWGGGYSRGAGRGNWVSNCKSEAGA